MSEQPEGLRITDRGRLAVVIMRTCRKVSLDEAEAIIDAMFGEKDGAALSGEMLRTWDSKAKP